MTSISLLESGARRSYRSQGLAALVAAVALICALAPPAAAGPTCLSTVGTYNVNACMGENQLNNYALLFEGAGANTLQITNVKVLAGNIGVGGTGKVADSGPSSINGVIDFSAANTGQFKSTNAANTFVNGSHVATIDYGVSQVATDLAIVNDANAVLGAENGTHISIGGGNGQTLTVNAANGVKDAYGNRVFYVTAFNTTNNQTLKIIGDAANDSVVLNFSANTNFNAQVQLTNIDKGQVLYNFVGGANLHNGPTLTINDNASASASNNISGIFLDPNGTISITNSNLVGARVFGGDSHDMQFVSGDTLAWSNPHHRLPEPPTYALFALGMIGLWLVRRRTAVRSAG